MSLMNENVVLQLNGSWQPICVVTPEKAFIKMAGGERLGMVIEGEDKLYPVNWDEWIKLPPLNPEFTAHTSHSVVRIPTVIIAPNYRKMPMTRPRLTRDNIFRRDKFKCVYSGRHLRPSEATIDHVLPVSRDGKTEWENLVTCDREINTMKADRTPDEAGLTMQYDPASPKVIPASAMIRNTRGIREWALFLHG